MNKIMALSLVTVAVFSAAASTMLVKPAAPAAAPAPDDPRRASYAARLAPELVVPAQLPKGIEDSHMLEAWIRLYNHTEAITLWDGSTTSGRALAQYLLDNDIPVRWDVEGVCQGSCSVRYCTKDGACSFEDGQPGAEPIFVHPSYANDINSLVLILAHETFHRTQPFGVAPDTRFEEFWAFRLEAQIAPATAMKFDGVNPLNPAELEQWLKANGLSGYDILPQYPAQVLPIVAAAH